MRSQDQGRHFPAKLVRRVHEAAEAALARKQQVSAIDVLCGIGWLTGDQVDRWRQGRAGALEELTDVAPAKLRAAVTILADWARARSLCASQVEYVAGTRDRPPLSFTETGEQALERSYATQWSSPNLSDAKHESVPARQRKPPDLVVVQPSKGFICAGCGDHRRDLLLMEDAGPICLACVDLDHLVFLPSGNTALTRRARKASTLSAVVVQWSRSRKRYERQGVLVEEAALKLAEEQCLADEDIRERRRERDRERRANQDLELQNQMTELIRQLFPGCPTDRAERIARHTATRGSGRVGRSAAGRALDPDAVTLAVVAAVRHEDTEYDELLMSGVPRHLARDQVWSTIDDVLARWRLTRPDGSGA